MCIFKSIDGLSSCVYTGFASGKYKVLLAVQIKKVILEEVSTNPSLSENFYVSIDWLILLYTSLILKPVCHESFFKSNNLVFLSFDDFFMASTMYSNLDFKHCLIFYYNDGKKMIFIEWTLIINSLVQDAVKLWTKKYQHKPKLVKLFKAHFLKKNLWFSKYLKNRTISRINSLFT